MSADQHPMAAAATAYADRPLAIHLRCHFAALSLLALAVLVDSAALARLGALTGVVGAGAYGWFFVNVLRRTRAAQAAQPADPTRGARTRPAGPPS